MELWKSALAALKTPEPSAQMYCTHLSDPDAQWLLSLSPQLKGLTPQQKSLARLKIQTLLHKMEFCSGSSDAMFRYFWTLLKYVLCIEWWWFMIYVVQQIPCNQPAPCRGSILLESPSGPAHGRARLWSWAQSSARLCGPPANTLLTLSLPRVINVEFPLQPHQ